MSVAQFTTWADTTEQTVYAAPCRLRSIEIYPNEAQAAEVYLQLFDVLDPTPGVTAPNMVIRIPTADSQGAGTHGNSYTVSGGSSRKQKVIFSGSGLVFATGLTAFCATAISGATAPTTTSLPKLIRVDFTPHA